MRDSYRRIHIEAIAVCIQLTGLHPAFGMIDNRARTLYLVHGDLGLREKGEPSNYALCTELFCDPTRIGCMFPCRRIITPR